MLPLLTFLAGALAASLLLLALQRSRHGDGEHLLAGLREELARFDGRQELLSRELAVRLHTLGEHQAEVVRHTGQLAEALRRPGMRGRWGELTLRNVVESAGLIEHVDFSEQPRMEGDDGVARPDLVVRLPGGGCVVVDAKAPLDAYLDAMHADESEQGRHLDRHVRDVRARVRELAGRAYWTRVRGSPEMVVMFVPSEAAFAAAAARDPKLLEDAARERVVIATPASMLALLQVVALGWREAAMSEHAERVRTLAHELVGRLGSVAGHLARQSRALEAAVQAHNAAVGSFESRLLVSARRITELGVTAPASLDEPAPVLAAVRHPTPSAEQLSPFGSRLQEGELEAAAGPRH